LFNEVLAVLGAVGDLAGISQVHLLGFKEIMKEIDKKPEPLTMYIIYGGLSAKYEHFIYK